VNLLEARVALRPRSMSDVLDLAGPFCLANRRLFAPLALWVTSVGGLLAFLCRYVGWSWPLVWLVVGAYLFFANGAYTVAAGELLFRQPAELRVSRVLARFGRKFATYVAARFLPLLWLAICAAVTVPLPIFAARLHFTGEAVLLESASPAGSLARSGRLVLHRSVPCFGLALACAAAPFLFAMGTDLIGDTLVDMILQMGEPAGSLWSDGGSAFAVVGALLSAPFVASARFLGYIDLRTRKEGWDIQLRFMALADAEARHQRIAS
jgi:hypothetical protein